MLADPHFKILNYEPDGSKVFPNTDIKGGVAISYHDNKTVFGPIEVFTSFPELNSIMHKAAPKSENESITAVAYNQSKFNLEALYADYPKFEKIIGSNGRDKRFRNNIFEKIDLFSIEKKNDNDISVLGLIKNKRVWRFFPKKYIDTTHENLFRYKVLVPSANGSGAIGEVLSTPLIGEPLIGYTQSFLGIGSFETQIEAENALKYIRSKFARTMLGILKITQHNPPEKWKYVPLQDFTSMSDIDWNQSVADIDVQLYRKYGLDEAEIAFIESHVKEME